MDEVCECLRPLLKKLETEKVLKILTRDFVDPDSLGLSRVAQFQYNEPNPYLMADVAGCILELLDKCLKVDSRIFSKHSVKKGLLRYSLSDKVS
jgi:hypothetical protein